MAKQNTKLTESLEAAVDPLSPDSQLKAIRDLERKLAGAESKLRAESAKRLQAENELAATRERIELFEATQTEPQARKIAEAKKKPRANCSMILCCNDWHAEERVDADMVNGVNEFNLDIADKRIERTFRKSIYLLDGMRALAKIDELVLWLGGDLINGWIHEEMESTNFLGPSEAILWVQDRVAGGIDYLLKNADVKRLRIVTSMGNHGRATRSRRISDGYKQSWEYVIYRNLERQYEREKAVSWHVTRGYHSWEEIQSHAIRFHHGEHIRYMGGVGGVHIPLRKAVAQWNKQRVAAFDVLGHLHQFIDDWNYVMSGCLVGYGPYALSIKAEIQPPTQTAIFVSEKHGKFATLPIFCAD